MSRPTPAFAPSLPLLPFQQPLRTPSARPAPRGASPTVVACASSRPAENPFAGGRNLGPPSADALGRVSQEDLDEKALWAAGFESLMLPRVTAFNGEIDLPGSKSLSNRVLLLAALAEGETCVENLLESDDISYMKDALTKLGVVHEERDGVTVVKGGKFGKEAVLDLGNAGTAMRPLAAVLTAVGGEFVLDGVERMRERPIVDLVDGLKQLGGQVECGENGCPPVRISGGRLKGGTAKVSGKISSQYLSAMLMAAPLADGEVRIEIVDDLISLPYVKLTIGLMAKFGVEVECDEGSRVFTVRDGQKYKSPGRFFVEGDASSASYFMAGAAITGGTVTVRGCGSESVQGDVEFANVLESMGATVTWAPTSITVTREAGKKLQGVTVSCLNIPDAAMTLASVALFAEGPTEIRDVGSWRVKETERMKAIVKECQKLGAEVVEGDDWCRIIPFSCILPDVYVETYDDHRMAMAMSLAACGGIVHIIDPACVGKTFPTYWKEFQRLTNPTDDIKRRVMSGEGF